MGLYQLMEPFSTEHATKTIVSTDLKVKEPLIILGTDFNSIDNIENAKKIVHNKNPVIVAVELHYETDNYLTGENLSSLMVLII